ncbi:MAG: phosphoribosyltransferase, partial [Acidimicrobiaceae bacterium TMED130]
MSDERETLTWESYGTAARDLAKIVAEDSYQPDIILAIARGGLFVAGSLGYALSVKNLYVMNVEYYTGVDERLDVPVALPPYLDSIDLRNARVLIADDVADTGATLAYVHEFCQSEVADVRSAVLYEKTPSIIKCEYVWKRTDNWINF